MNFNKANMMKGKDRFTSAEIVKLRELITERQNAPRNSQKQLRNRMRKIGFFGRDDWGIIDCTLDDLDELIDTGKIKIIDKKSIKYYVKCATFWNEPCELVSFLVCGHRFALSWILRSSLHPLHCLLEVSLSPRLLVPSRRLHES